MRGAQTRNRLSKRGDYARTAPETESGVGPMDAVFTKCERCGQPIYKRDLAARFNVCPHCEFHYPLPAPQRVRLLTDRGSFEERDGGLIGGDPLGFEGYEERLQKARQKTGLDDAILSGVGSVGGRGGGVGGRGFPATGGAG